MSIEKSKFTEILLNSQHHDPSIHKPAQELLVNFEKQDIVQFINAVCTQIADAEIHLNARLLACISLKNCVSSHSTTTKSIYASRWMAFDENLRTQIRQLLMQTLPSDHRNLRDTAGAALAAIASIEIPRGVGIDIVGILTNAIQGADTPAFMKEACLIVIGDICESIESEALGSYCDSILTSIAVSIQAPANNIKLAAIKALTAALKFCKKNFEVEHERTMIINMVLEAVKDQDEDIRTAAWECFCNIAELYYSDLSAYMTTIYAISLTSIDGPDAKAAMMAIEFWSVIAKYEVDILEEEAIAQDQGETFTSFSHNFCKTALTSLVPVLLKALGKQDEDADDDSWSIPSAAGLCLTYLSQVGGADMCNIVIPIVTDNINSPDWRFRDASLTAFGCILTIPDVNSLLSTTTQAFPIFINLLNDPQPHVRDSAAWVLSQICEYLPEVFEDEKLLMTFMEASLVSLDGRVRTANNICKAIYNIAENCNIDMANSTNLLSQFFYGLVSKLITVAEATDDISLLVNCYEAIANLINRSAPDVHHHVISLLPILGSRLESSINQNLGTGEHKIFVQALLCCSLEAIVNIISVEEITKYADHLMSIFISVLSNDNGVNEEALLAIAAVARQLGDQFQKYLETVVNVVVKCCQEKDSVHTLRTSVNTLATIISSVGLTIQPYCDVIASTLLGIIADEHIDRTVKPLAIEGIADICLAIDVNFNRYLSTTMTSVLSASEASISKSYPDPDYDLVEYLLSLQHAILTLYNAIIITFCEANQGATLKDYISPMLDYVVYLSTDPEIDYANTQKCAECVFDLISYSNSIDPTLPAFIKNHNIYVLLQKLASHRKQDIKKISVKALSVLAKF